MPVAELEEIHHLPTGSGFLLAAREQRPQVFPLQQVGAPVEHRGPAAPCMGAHDAVPMVPLPPNVGGPRPECPPSWWPRQSPGCRVLVPAQEAVTAGGHTDGGLSPQPPPIHDGGNPPVQDGAAGPATLLVGTSRRRERARWAGRASAPDPGSRHAPSERGLRIGKGSRESIGRRDGSRLQPESPRWGRPSSWPGPGSDSRDGGGLQPTPDAGDRSSPNFSG